MSSDEQQLRDVLHGRAEGVDATSDLAGPAIALAHRRRRRTVVAAVAAVAVLVGGVGVASWAARPGPTPAPTPVPATRTSTLAPPSSSPTPTPTESPSPSSTPTQSSTPTPSKSEPSPAAAVPWALDGTIHVGDRTVEVPGGRVVTDLAALEGDRLLVRTVPAGDPANGRWLVLDRDGGRVADLGPGDVGVTDGATIAVQEGFGGEVHVFDASGSRTATLAVGDRGLRAVVGRLVLLASLDGPSALVNVRSGAETKLPAGTRRVTPDAHHAFGTTGGLGDSTCWFVVDLSRGTSKTAEHCGADDPAEFGPRSMSTDERLLLGTTLTDGGFYDWFAVVEVDGGAVLLDHDRYGDRVAGWTAAFDPGTTTFLLSRDAARPASPATSNDLVRCTTTMDCTTVGKAVALKTDDRSDYTTPRYVVGQPLAP